MKKEMNHEALPFATIPAGAEISYGQVSVLFDAWVRRCGRAFEEEEVRRFLETGLLDVTNHSEVEITVSVEPNAADKSVFVNQDGAIAIEGNTEFISDMLNRSLKQQIAKLLK
jgi:hypothetical protein